MRVKKTRVISTFLTGFLLLLILFSVTKIFIRYQKATEHSPVAIEKKRDAMPSNEQVDEVQKEDVVEMKSENIEEVVAGGFNPVLEEVGDHGLVFYSLSGQNGVVLCFHGTGGSAKGWDKPGDDNLEFLEDMAEAGWSYVCPTSINRDTKQWSPVNDLSNPDVKNVDSLLDTLGISNKTPIILVGHSNGTGMSSRYAIGSKRAGDIVAIQLSNSSGLTPAMERPGYVYPTLFNYAHCDNVVNDNGPQENYQVLLSRGVRTELNKLDDVYEVGDYKSCHEFVNTGTKVLELIN